MDDQGGFEPTPMPPDAELASQLRAYAQALAATRGATAQAPAAPAAMVDVAGLRTTAGRRRRLARLTAAAAAAVIAVGAAGWWAASRNTSSVSTDDPAPTTTGTTDPVATTAAAGEAGVHLLPDLSAWAVIDHSADPTGPPIDQHGIWVWRLDGRLVTLSEGVFVDRSVPRSEATVDVSNGRTSLTWTDAGVGFDLQGIGVDEAALRAALAALTQARDGWDLPGASPVASEAAGPGETGVTEQLTLVPRDGAGVPVLTSQVQSTIRPGSAADLFRELHEASGAGDVTETTIAGRPGFVIDGPDFAYALVAIDGWVVNWSATAFTADRGVDLPALLASTRAVPAEDWRRAIAGIDATLGEVVAAADVDPIDDAAGAAPLPRYVLPSPWTFEWVTDMGIWTPEQRAQRQALDAANTPAGAATVRTVRAQGFRTTSSPTLPIDVPEVTLEVAAFDGEATAGAFAEAGVEPIAVAGLQGTIYPEGTVHGWGAGAELAGGHLAVSIRTNGMTADEVRAFVQGLTARGGDPAAGFSLAPSSGQQEIYDLDADQIPVWNPLSFWAGAWRSGRGGGTGPTIRVERLSLGQLQHQLAMETWPDSVLSSAGGGRYLAATTTYNQASVVGDGSTASTVLIEGATGTRSTLTRYDPTRQLVISLSVNGTVDDTLDLMGQLTEVDLTSWESLVAPVNADPLHPR